MVCSIYSTLRQSHLKFMDMVWCEQSINLDLQVLSTWYWGWRSWKLAGPLSVKGAVLSGHGLASSRVELGQTGCSVEAGPRLAVSYLCWQITCLVYEAWGRCARVLDLPERLVFAILYRHFERGSELDYRRLGFLNRACFIALRLTFSGLIIYLNDTSLSYHKSLTWKELPWLEKRVKTFHT